MADPTLNPSVSSTSAIKPPKVIQQGCHGLASAIEGDPSYIRLGGATTTVDYRGPAVGSQAAPIDPGLVAQYAFEPAGLLGQVNQPATWRLNSVGNYVRYHCASLLESYRRNGGSEPISTVILGCTHFPFYQDEIAASLMRLRNFHAPDGAEPYKSLLVDKPLFLDPAELTAKQLYETLLESGLLLKKREASPLVVDEFYISVPNASLPGVKLAEGGGFTYEYKYGREPGHFKAESVQCVPMSRANLAPAAREMIQAKMPVVWNRLVAFNERSLRMRDLPEAERLKPGP